jgi:hypothetical protein
LRAVAIAIFLPVIFFLFSGALGLKTISQCDSDVTLTRDAEMMQCYYTAAVSTAYLCGSLPSGHYGSCGDAVTICNDIWLRWGEPNAVNGPKKDVRRKAELLSNNCFYDVAKINRNSETCGYIVQHDNMGTQLFGDRATQEICIQETTSLAKIAPENYYANNQDNICSIVFVLPFIVLGAIRFPGP